MYLIYKIKFNFILILAAVIIFLPFLAKASSTNGVIDSTYKYAWSENIGWINFKTDNGNVKVTDSAITGYAWSANYGWINLDPATSGVINNGYGNLSGYAWGENIGWIDFSGTQIDSEGYFIGYASSTVSGRISLNCANNNSCASYNFKVRTDWRPRPQRAICNNNLDDDGDGLIDYPNDPGCESLIDTDETDHISISPVYGVLAPLLPIQTEEEEIEESEEEQLEEPIMAPKEDLKEEKLVKKTEENKETVLKEIKKTFKKIFSNLKISRLPKLPELFIKNFKAKILKDYWSRLAKLPVKKIISFKAPLSMSGGIKLINQEPLKKFVLSPLPKSVNTLAEKFPKIKDIYLKAKVARMADINKLVGIKFNLPGLKEASGLVDSNLSPRELAKFKSLPISDLPASYKSSIPTEVIFAQAGGEAIDLNINVSFTDQGLPQQKFKVIAGKKLTLTIKPEFSAKVVKGYLIYRQSKTTALNSDNKFRLSIFKPALAENISVLTGIKFSLQSLFNSLLFDQPAFAQDLVRPVKMEEKLVLLEFEYKDEDKDGIYQAEIQAPVVEGEYEIITVIEYEDPDLGARAIKLTTVIDPEGYVYEKIGNKEARLSGTIITIFWLNPETSQYELWPGDEYSQDNPQITNITGRYAFLVPPGNYYLRAESPGYLFYESKPFNVRENSGVHFNIEMKTKYWFLKIADWKTLALILVIIMLAFNFYRDKKRKTRIISNKEN